ncbi:MAG: hypothetical protein KJ626_02200 [Verrucomicrobia bacterium]|nr:hypothetical protein [Verrucomicrobiota bacterium]
MNSTLPYLKLLAVGFSLTLISVVKGDALSLHQEIISSESGPNVAVGESLCVSTMPVNEEEENIYACFKVFKRTIALVGEYDMHPGGSGEQTLRLRHRELPVDNRINELNLWSDFFLSRHTPILYVSGTRNHTEESSYCFRFSEPGLYRITETWQSVRSPHQEEQPFFEGELVASMLVHVRPGVPGKQRYSKEIVVKLKDATTTLIRVRRAVE